MSISKLKYLSHWLMDLKRRRLRLYLYVYLYLYLYLHLHLYFQFKRVMSGSLVDGSEKVEAKTVFVCVLEFVFVFVFVFAFVNKFVFPI